MHSFVKTSKFTLIFSLFILFIYPLYAESDETPEEILPAEEPAIEETAALTEEIAEIEVPAIAEEPSAADEYDEFIDFDDPLFFEAPALVFEAPVFEPRSFDDVFPGLSRANKRQALSSFGLRYAFEKGGEATLTPSPDSGIDILNSFVLTKKPSHIIEALVLVPYNKRELDMLDIYNALGNVQEIKDQILSYNDKTYQIFKETTRLDNAKNRKPIADPKPADSLPLSETMYIRFTDAYIGEMYLRGDITFSLYGVTYSITNFRDVNYSIFRIMKAERFSAVIYIEPVKEGILIYSASGIYLPGFIVSRLNLNANINNRITVLLSWITQGLRRQENLREKPSIPFAVN